MQNFFLEALEFLFIGKLNPACNHNGGEVLAHFQWYDVQVLSEEDQGQMEVTSVQLSSY